MSFNRQALRRWARNLAIAGFVFVLFFLLIHTSPARNLVASLVTTTAAWLFDMEVSIGNLDYRLWRGEARVARLRLVSEQGEAPFQLEVSHVVLDLSSSFDLSVELTRPRLNLSIRESQEPAGEGDNLFTLPSYLPDIKIVEGGIVVESDVGARVAIDAFELEAEHGPDAYEATVHVPEALVLLGDHEVSLGPVRADFALQDTRLVIKKLELRSGTSKLEARGSFETSSGLDGILDIDYELDETLLEGLLPEEELSGSLSGQAHIELADGHFRATSDFPGTVVLYGDARVDIDGRLEFADDVAHIHPLTVRTYDGRAELEARLDLRDGGRQEFRGRCEGLDVISLANDLLEVELPLASLAQVEGELVLEDWSLDGADARAEIEFYPLQRQGMLPVGGTLVLDGAANDLQFRARLNSDAFGSELNLAGRLAEGNLRAEYEVRMNDLADPEIGWRRFIPTELEGRLSASGEISGPLLDPLWTATIGSSNLQIGEAPFRLAAEAAGSFERARLESLTLEGREGRLAAQGEIPFDSSSTWDLELEVTDLSIEPLVDRLDLPLSGKIDARGKLLGSAANPDWSLSAQLVELPGQVNLSLEKKGGRITLTELRASIEGGLLEGTGAYLIDSESVELQLDWQDLSLSRVLDFPTDIEGIEGRLSGSLEVEGPWRAPRGRARLDLHDALLFGHELAAFALTLESDGEALELELQREGSPLARGTGRLQDPYPLQVGVDLALLPLSALFRGLTGLQVDVTAGGQLDIDLAATRLDELKYRARVERYDMELPERRLRASPFTLEGDLESVRIRDLELSSQAGKLTVAGVVPLQEEGRFDLVLSGDIGLNSLKALVPEIDASGRAHVEGKVTGTLAVPEPVGQIEIFNATGSWQGFDWNDFNLRASAERGRLQLQSARGGFLGGEVEIRGVIPLPLSDTAESGRLEIALEGIDLGHLVPAEFEVRPQLLLDARGVIYGSGLGIEHLEGSGEISRFVAGVGRYQIQNPETIPWHLEAGAFSIPRLRLTGNETDLTLGLGPFQLGEETSWQASIQGTLENAFLNPFLSTIPGMQISGTSQLDFQMSDGPDGFAVDGRGTVRSGRFVIPQPPLALSNLRGELSFEGTKVKLSGLTARLGGGTLAGEGTVDLREPGNPDVDFELAADEVSLQIMEGLRGRFAGSVRFRGRPGDFLLSGNLRMIRGLMDMEFDADSDVGGSRDLMLAGAELEESFEDHVALDILFNTERDLRIENSIARLEASGNLSLSGTLANPEVSGTFLAKQDGTFQIGRNRFQLLLGRVDIDGYPLSSPDIQVSALTRVGNILIRLDADGGIDDLRTRLSAPEETDLTEGDLMSLLVTGRTLENAAEGGQQMATSWAMSSMADMLHEGWGKAFSFGGPPSGAGPITLSEEKDPTSRFTAGMPITDDLSLTYSIALDEAESQLWILDYQVARNLWLRAIQENSSQYTLGFSHRLELDWTRSPYEVSAGRAATEIVANVSLEGQIPSSGGQLLQKVRLKPGDRYDYWVAREDAARMEASLIGEGYRSAVVDVEGRLDGDELALIFLVEAGPPLEIVWQGENPGNDFKKKIEGAWNGRIPEEFLVPDLAKRATRELRANRYYSARVEASVDETESGQRVVFDVNRGPRGSRVVLEFVGNETLADRELVDALPPTPSLAFFALLDKPSELEKGLRLRYASKGYLGASIGEVETNFDATDQEFRVTIPVSEGVLSPITQIGFEGVEALSDSKLRQAVKLREGQPFSMSEVRQSQTELRATYREEGFPDVRIKSVMERMPEGIRVTFQVEEGYRVRVGRVRIVGQHKTRDWVILRELTFKEGDPLLVSELQRSQKRLFDLGIFRSADVRIESEGRGEEVQDVVVQVVEQTDLDVNYGLRYNFRTSDETTTRVRSEGLEGHVRARLINTLGRGSNLAVAAFIRGDGNLYRVSYQVPRFFGWRIPTQLYFEQEQDIRQEDLDIALDQWSVSVQQTRRLEEGASAFRDKLSLQWNFSFGRFVLAEGEALRSEDVSIEEAAFRKEFRTVLGVSLIEDRRDSIANPTRGRFANITFQVSPQILGSDTAFFRVYGQLFYFYPLHESLVWASSYRLGLAAGSEEFLFIDNRFTAGGANSVRGFEQSSLGPFVDIDETRVYVGGQAVVVMNQELRFPIYKSLHGGAYYDVGNVYLSAKDLSLDDLRHSLGAGLRFVLPVGAIRLDWARVLNPQPEDRLNRFHFSFGYAF